MENKMNFDNDNLTDTPLQGYHETKKHTDALFPFNIYLCTIPDDFPSVFLHWQDTMEIIYIKKGKGLAQVDLDTFQIGDGDIVFAPPGHLHGLSRIPHERMEYENIIFDLSLLDMQPKISGSAKERAAVIPCLHHGERHTASPGLGLP